MARLKKMTYYAFQYAAGVNTTAGVPNVVTQRMSIAGDVAVFSNVANRDLWVNQLCHRTRASLTVSAARAHCDGITLREFKEHCYSILDNELDTLLSAKGVIHG